MIYQYAINTNGILSMKEVSELLYIISDERRKKIDRLCFMKDKVHSLFAEVILRYALWERYSIYGPYIEFEQSEYGKPSLTNYKDIHFNLAHSGSWVLCGIGDISLGIDVEQINEMKFSIADRIYTKEENYFILKQSLENRKKAFYKIWTLKESYVKNIGKGLSIPFDSFSFQFYDNKIQFYLQGEKNNNLLFKTGQLDDQHLTALCVDSKCDNLALKKVKILTVKELMKWRNS
ncbi:4'-phosphopantetheinyl transferase superfamily protein [Anaerocolumna sp. AGMB13025]|uniref:4'-phosphopantetheinyl transferase family protein n=1 Tax=Anaerocolumna sp. AGMB13025 TaxID=3039116 RepID=UPI00241FC6BE|nr:4'-phosphopantetheinyl transferase superfamily protein [Anaerocolumna sp. AGMB13025]WFR57109.1 4'-phosphopantetheinyl transferase superfamily protein [Anaerocolumna sp. AGMB13025]